MVNIGVQIIEEFEQFSNLALSSGGLGEEKMKMLVLSYKKEKELMQHQYDNMMTRYRYDNCSFLIKNII